MIRYTLAITLALSSPAFAQQPGQPSPSQTAIQIDNVVNQWAQQLEADQQNLKAKDEKLTAVQKEIDELKIKCGDLCKDVPK